MKTRFFIIATVLAMAPAAWAVNLIEVYKQALSSDPTFKAANSQWLADRETLSIKRGALLPQLSASGSIAREHNDTSSSSQVFITSQNHFYNNKAQYSLQLTQPLFHFGDWASVWQAQAIAKQAEVTFLAAAEDLLLRTSKAYFGVLQSRDVLHFARANREALGSTLNQAKHKYDVGLIAIVDLENARADYDRAISDEIAADNDLSDKLEQLNEITGVRYIYLNPIKASFPLLLPQPFDSEKWVKAAEQQNFDLAATRYATIVARENIKIQNAGHLPTLDATGSYTYYSNSNPGNAVAAFRRDKIASVGLGLNLPLFQGGRVLSATRQANYQYQKAIADQETKYRSTVSLTRQAYLGVISNVSEIKANRQAIKSAQSSLRATKAGYEAGTRTMVDVLNAQAKLYESQKNFAVSEYNYIIQLLTLKQLTGILDASDLRQINTWLEIPECDKCIPDKNHKKHHKSVKKTRTHKKEAPANKSDFTKSIIESPIVAVDPDKEKQLDITNIGSDLKP